MKGIGSFVHSTIQEFGDAELPDISSHFVRSSA